MEDEKFEHIGVLENKEVTLVRVRQSRGNLDGARSDEENSRSTAS